MKKNCQRSSGSIIPVAIFVVLLALSFSTVSALSVSGAVYSGSIAAGGTDTHTMGISIGPDEEALDVSIAVMGLGQTLDRNFISLDPGDDLSPYSARTYITLDNSSIHLEPGTTRNVTATIKLPSDVGAGGRYATIYIHGLPGAGKALTTAVIVPVLITVSGTGPILSGSITNVSVEEVTVGQPIAITTTFKNTGNSHYPNSVNTITVTDATKKILATVSTQPSSFSIIPGNTIQYVLTPDLQNLPVGTYTADSKVLLESGTVLDEKTITFTVTTKYTPPVTDSNITLTPGSAGVLTSPDGRYSVSFPQDAVLGDAVVTLKPHSRANLQPAPPGANLGASCFEITGLNGLLSKNATVRVIYSADDLTAADGDASRLELSYYDPAQGTWVIIPTQVDTQSATLTATTNHLSVWAVMITVSPPVTAEATSGAGLMNAPTQAPVPLAMIILSLVIAVIAAGYSTGKRK
jgi:hypothetical protein